MVDNYGYKHTLRTRLKVTFRYTLPVLYRNKRNQNYYLHFNIIQSLEFAQSFGNSSIYQSKSVCFPICFYV